MSRSPILFLIMSVALAAAGAACGSDSSAPPEGKLRIVTTVAPVTSLVENVGGAKIDLRGLIPEGVNSHTYEPPVSDVKAIEDADLIILNGLQLEEPALELAKANKKTGAEILLLGDTAVKPEDYKFDFSFPESAGKPNPHVWPNAALTMEYVKLIHSKLVDLDAGNQDYYDANFNELMKRLEVLDQQMRVAVQTVPPENRKLLTYHDSWAYWAERYGMTVIGAIQPSDFAEPSAREVADLIDQVNKERVPAIFGSEVFPSPVLEEIANETGARYVDDLRDDDLPGGPGDDLHSYLGLMVEDMRIMIPALGGDDAPMRLVQPGLVFEGPGTAKYPQ